MILKIGRGKIMKKRINLFEPDIEWLKGSFEAKKKLKGKK